MRILPLPFEIESWISAWWLILPGEDPSWEIQQRITTARGADGRNFLIQSKLAMTTTLTNSTRTRLLSVFAQSIRNSDFSKHNDSPVAASTCRHTVDCVAQTFRNQQKDDPRFDSSGKLSRILSRQYASYKNAGPPTKQQKAVPVSLLKKVVEVRNTARNKAFGEVIVGAFFYAMRSCDYLFATASERKTKRLKLKNLRFFCNGRLIQHWDPLLPSSDFVTVKQW